MKYNSNKLNKGKSYEVFLNLNWIVFAVIFLLFLTGCMVIFSASGGHFQPLVEKHVYKFLFSVIIFFLICFLKYEFIKSYSYYYYLLSIIFLIFLIFLGTESAGSKRWINLGFFSFPESEYGYVTRTAPLFRSHRSDLSAAEAIYDNGDANGV